MSRRLQRSWRHTHTWNMPSMPLQSRCRSSVRSCCTASSKSWFADLSASDSAAAVGSGPARCHAAQTRVQQRAMPGKCAPASAIGSQCPAPTLFPWRNKHHLQPKRVQPSALHLHAAHCRQRSAFAACFLLIRYNKGAPLPRHAAVSVADERAMTYRTHHLAPLLTPCGWLPRARPPRLCKSHRRLRPCALFRLAHA